MFLMVKETSPVDNLDYSIDNLSKINNRIKEKYRHEFYEKVFKYYDLNSITSEYDLDRLDPRIKHIIARNSIGRFLGKLSRDIEVSIRNNVACNLGTQDAILEKLSNDSEMSVRCYVAINKYCPIEVLEKLSNDEIALVRNHVVNNANCPADILDKLSDDKDSVIKECIAYNKNCSVETLTKLSKEKSYYIRYAVVSNTNCPDALLDKLESVVENDEVLAAIERTRATKALGIKCL